MQQPFSYINPFNSAPHVSGDKFAHPQEIFLTVYTAFGTMQSRSAIVPCVGNKELVHFEKTGNSLESLTFRRRIKSRLPFAGIISSPYSTRFQNKG